jgi:hypothetical protein
MSTFPQKKPKEPLTLDGIEVTFATGGSEGMWREGLRVPVKTPWGALSGEIIGVSRTDRTWKDGEDVYPFTYYVKIRIGADPVHLSHGLPAGAGGPADQGRVGGHEDGASAMGRLAETVQGPALSPGERQRLS